MDFKTAQKEALSGWFSEGDCKVKVKSLEASDLEAIEDEFTVTKHEFVHNEVKNKLERVEWKEGGDEEQKALALASRLIVEWENIEIDGKPAECTDENKRILLAESLEFRNFYTKSINEITKQVKAEYGSTSPSKNSKSTRRKK